MKFDSEIIEAERIRALKALKVLDTPRDDRFDNITKLAAKLLDSPIALITLVDESRQWYKSTFGLYVEESFVKDSFCRYTVKQSAIFEIPDTLADVRFEDHPMVTGTPHIRAYAGAPLTNKQGHHLGALCVLSFEPKTLSQKEREILELLAEQTVSLLELHEQQRINNKLKVAFEEKVHLLNEISSDMLILIVYWDKDQVCRFVSNSYCKQIGKTSEQVLGRHYDDVVPRKLAAVVKPSFLRALSGHESKSDANDAIYKNSDNIRHFQYIPDFDASGNVRGVLSLITDITFQRKAEDNAALFSQVIGHSSDCIIITDAEYDIIYVNNSFTNITQYTLEEVSGKTPDFLFSGKQYNSSLSEIQALLKHADHWKGDLWHTKKNGSVFFALVSIDVIRDIHDNITHYIFSLRDQTENEKMRADLFIMTDMLNRTGKMAKVGGWEYNLISKKLLWTDEVFRIHELPIATEPDISTALDYYPPEARNIITQTIQSATIDGKPWDLELPFVTEKGNHRWVRATGECILFNQKPIKLIGTFQDITDRKLAELQKEKDERKHRNTLIREVHHRIKNNLQGVSGILSNFAEKHPQQAPLFNEANAQLQSVAVIYGLQSHQPGAFIEVGELTFAIKNNIERLWQTEIGFNIDENWVKAYANKNESVPLALIINELITNAVKHQVEDKSANITLKHQAFNASEFTTINSKTLITVSNKGNFTDANNDDVLVQNKTQSGLALMNTLMPKTGANTHWDINDKMIQVSLELSYPVVSFEKQENTQGEAL